MNARRLIDIMVDRDLFSILRAVNEYRNNWLGHGGVKKKTKSVSST